MTTHIRPSNDYLPLGLSDFSAFRSNDIIYVDKTDLICQLASMRRFYFIARPRRFGKSLLISTLKELFSRGSEAINGLKGEKTWSDRNTYPVLSMDFSFVSEFQSKDEFLTKFYEHVREVITLAGLSIPDIETRNPGMLLMHAINQSERPVVLLIDEYDSPLATHLHHSGLFESVRAELSEFFKRVKSTTGKLRFLFVTGILRFQQTELFSGFNSIIDISLDPDYGALLGYTEREIEAYFSDYLDSASAVLACSRAEIIDQMRLMYDGYCFDENGSKHVYAPWSVLNFLSNPNKGFRHYWYDSGGTSSLFLNYLKGRSDKTGTLNPEKFDQLHELDKSMLSGPVQTNDQGELMLDEYVLLTQAGYLTIRSVDGQSVFVGFPNQEVRIALAMLYRRSFWSSMAVCNGIMRDFQKALLLGDSKDLEAALNAMLHELVYETYPLRSESVVRALVQIFCLGGALDARAEVHSFRGRSDLEISIGDTDLIIEFKYVRESDETAKGLSAALVQLRARSYGLERSGRRLRRMAAVYCEAARKFSIAEDTEALRP